MPTYDMWRESSLATRALSLLTGRWEPEGAALRDAASTVFESLIFGGVDDFGPELMDMTRARLSEDCTFENLSAEGKLRADALVATGVSTSQVLGRVESPYLNTHLAKH